MTKPDDVETKSWQEDLDELTSDLADASMKHDVGEMWKANCAISDYFDRAIMKAQQDERDKATGEANNFEVGYLASLSLPQLRDALENRTESAATHLHNYKIFRDETDGNKDGRQEVRCDFWMDMTIQSLRDAKLFAQAIRNRSSENKGEL